MQRVLHVPEALFDFSAIDPTYLSPQPAYIRTPNPSAGGVAFSILVPHPRGPSIGNETEHALLLSWVTLIEICGVRAFHITLLCFRPTP